VVIQAPTKGGIWKPEVLDGVFTIHERMLYDLRVDHVQSLASLVPNPTAAYLQSLSPATILTSPDRTRIAKQVSTLHGDRRTTVIWLSASFGLLVIVFQWGLGDSLFSFQALGALEAYTPVMLFSVLFGLSTDYQVFLLTRVREQVHLGKANEEAIAVGLEQTA